MHICGKCLCIPKIVLILRTFLCCIVVWNRLFQCQSRIWGLLIQNHVSKAGIINYTAQYLCVITSPCLHTCFKQILICKFKDHCDCMMQGHSNDYKISKVFSKASLTITWITFRQLDDIIQIGRRGNVLTKNHAWKLDWQKMLALLDNIFCLCMTSYKVLIIRVCKERKGNKCLFLLYIVWF